MIPWLFIPDPLWWVGLGAMVGAAPLLPWCELLTPHVCTMDCRLFCRVQDIGADYGSLYGVSMAGCYNVRVSCLGAHSWSTHFVKERSFGAACREARRRHIDRKRPAMARIFPR